MKNFSIISNQSRGLNISLDNNKRSRFVGPLFNQNLPRRQAGSLSSTPDSYRDEQETDAMAEKVNVDARYCYK